MQRWQFYNISRGLEMIVAVGGMYRSGSTFSFNIIREILSSFGSVVTLSDNSLPNELVTQEHLIIKVGYPA